MPGGEALPMYVGRLSVRGGGMGGEHYHELDDVPGGHLAVIVVWDFA